MKFSFFVTIFIVFATFTIITDAAKVLGLFTTFSKSHLIIHMSVIRTLIERGHDVTVVTTLTMPNELHSEFRHIQLDVPKPTKEFMQSATKHKNLLTGFSNLLNETTTKANLSLHDPKMRDLMENECFDLVIMGYFFNDFQIGVAAHFNCPIVISWMQSPMKILNDMIGNPKEAFYVPHTFTGLQQPMGFFARVGNFLFSIFEIGLDRVIEQKMNYFYEQNFPSEKYPSFSQMKKNVSLIISSSHFTEGIIRPNVPALIEVGGIQVKPKPDLLPEDIRNHLDGATKYGVIYFCLGSNSRSADMDKERIEIIYNILSSLKQNVIWKWEEDRCPGNAPNILFKKWLPQDDILAHPNVKLFITHGGHGGIVEAEYHGVPMIGLPQFADQFSNMKHVEISGFGLNLGNKEFTKDLFRSAVLEVLENPKYRENVKKFSALYRDRPLSARETAAFWLEYVIRHRGAKHLQSPAVHMGTIQYYGLDVISFILIVLYISYKIICFIIMRILNKIFGSLYRWICRKKDERYHKCKQN